MHGRSLNYFNFFLLLINIASLLIKYIDISLKKKKHFIMYLIIMHSTKAFLLILHDPTFAHFAQLSLSIMNHSSYKKKDK